MAKTNWQDPKTSEMRSTHTSGLQEAVGKIEESIGISSVAETNIPLTEVFISNDDRLRIFQAPEGKRNWLLSPAPVIKKNGSVITQDFEIDYGGGAVIFTTPISESDVLTADATYTKKETTDLKTQISELAGDGRTTETVKGAYEAITAHEEAVDPHEQYALDTDLATLQTEVTAHTAEVATLSALGHVKHGVYTTTLDTTWSGSSAPYTKTQTVTGILATDTPIVDVVMSGTYETDEAIQEAWANIYRITTAANSITLYAKEKPTVSLPIQLKVVR